MHALLPASKVFAGAVGFTVFVVWVNFGPGSGHVRKPTRSPPSSPVAAASSSSAPDVSVTSSQSRGTSQDDDAAAVVRSKPRTQAKNGISASRPDTVGSLLQAAQPQKWSPELPVTSAGPSLTVASDENGLATGPGGDSSDGKQQTVDERHHENNTDSSISADVEEEDESGTRCHVFLRGPGSECVCWQNPLLNDVVDLCCC